MGVHTRQVLMLARVGVGSGGGVTPWSMLANSSLADALAASDPGTNATGTERYGAALDLNDRHLAVCVCMCVCVFVPGVVAIRPQLSRRALLLDGAISPAWS
jgi:hypothetical protein